MSEPEKRNPVEQLAESFLKRYRDGERPSLSEYLNKYPELADEIRQLFPALVVMEEVGAEHSDSVDAKRRDVTADGRQLERIADYRIIREVGRGGMGVVYEAEQESLGRHVALKVLPHWATRDPLCLQRFRREARSAARLHHTNIVPVYEVGEAQGIHYYAMQFIHGQSLDEILLELKRIRRPAPAARAPQPCPEVRLGNDCTKSLAGGLLSGQFEAEAERLLDAERGKAAPAAETQIDISVDRNEPETRSQSDLSNRSDSYYYRSIARIGLQIAEALSYAHGQRVLHRDIKPSNLLLDLAGTVWISDFGLAKEEGDDLTRTGDLVGTLRYMAPERFAGRCDPRSDIYSAGLTLHELLTLQSAFHEADRQQLVKEILTREPPGPRTIDRAVPRDLETIVLKAIAKEPDRRYQSAVEMAEDLRRFIGDRPILARRASLTERLWQWRRRNPVVAGLSLGMAVMAVLICIGSVVVALSLNRAAERAQRAEHDAQEQLFDSLLVQARAGRSSLRPGQRAEGLKAITHAARLGQVLKPDSSEVLKLRDEATACLALPDLNMEAEWEGNRPGTNGLGFDATFERYAWSFQEEGIRICRLADHREQLRLPTPPSDRVSRWVLMAFSPDGRYLAAFYVQWAREHPLEVWELGEESGRRIVALPDATALPAFAADGRSLVAPLPSGEAAVIELPSGRELRRFASGGPAEAVALQPLGTLLAVAGGSTEGVRVFDLASGALAQRLPHPDVVQGLAWSPDGKLLAAACNDLRIHLWDAVRWQKEAELAGHRYEVGDVAFDATGKWLASYGWDMTLRFWDVGSRRQVLKVEDIRILGFRSKAGLAAAGLSGRRVQVWGLRPSEVFQELHPFPAESVSFCFSPDGRWLAATTANRTRARVWDMSTWQEVYHQTGEPWGAWGPEGSSVLFFEKEGLSRVPLLTSSSGNGATSVFRFGQAQPLAGFREDVRNHMACWVGPESRRLMLIDPPGGQTPRTRIRLLELNAQTIHVRWEDSMLNANYAVASPDGRLVAVSSYWGGNGISVWETETGRQVRQLPIGDARMVFAADGRRLYTTTGRLSPHGAECRSWWSDSWEADRAIPLQRASHAPAGLCVAADGTVAVIVTSSDVRLFDPETFEEILTLSAPQPEVLQGVWFSPDRTTLGATASGTLHLWNLRRLHQELAEIGLAPTTRSQPQASAANARR
jgi:serine/threonine protein kinase/WD40 repeat protein